MTTNAQLLHPFWYHDGALRDIYLRDATLEVWTRLIEGLLAAPSFDLRYEQNGEPRPFPGVREVFDRDPDQSVILAAEREGVSFHTFFLDTDYIEFVADPREIQSPEAEAVALDFVRLLGRTTSRRVGLDVSGFDDDWLVYDPASDAIIESDVDRDWLKRPRGSWFRRYFGL